VEGFIDTAKEGSSKILHSISDTKERIKGTTERIKDEAVRDTKGIWHTIRWYWEWVVQNAIPLLVVFLLLLGPTALLRWYFPLNNVAQIHIHTELRPPKTITTPVIIQERTP